MAGLADKNNRKALFQEFVGLRLSESMVFSPAAMFKFLDGKPVTQGTGYIRMKIGGRLSVDGGKSVLAS